MHAIGRALIGAALAVGALCSAAEARTSNGFTSFWVLGDSLSDPGNLHAVTGTPQSPPYFDGRFSNGPVWAEYVAESFSRRNLATGNVAYGYARALPTAAPMPPDLQRQVQMVAGASAGKLGARPLASLWAGANDLIFAGIPSGNAAAVGRAAARSVAASAMMLHGLGFDDVMIFNMPNLSLVPLYNRGDPAAKARADRGSRIYNRTLDREIAGLEKAGLNVIEIDMAALIRALIADPAAFGVANATVPCLIPGAPPCTPEQAMLRAFFDPVHTNAVIHRAIAREVRAEVAPVPLPASALLLAAGLGGLGFVAVRRRAA